MKFKISSMHEFQSIGTNLIFFPFTSSCVVSSRLVCVDQMIQINVYKFDRYAELK